MSPLKKSEILFALVTADALGTIAAWSTSWQLDMITADEFADRVADLLVSVDERTRKLEIGSP